MQTEMSVITFVCSFCSEMEELSIPVASPCSTEASASRPCIVKPGPPLSKKVKRKDKDKKGEEIDDFLTRNVKALEETCAKPKDDEEELFGHQVAVNLRRFTARQKAQAKLSIQGVIMDTEFPEQPYALTVMLLPTRVNFLLQSLHILFTIII